MIITLLIIFSVLWLFATCYMFYAMGHREAERRMAPFRDPRIASGEIVEITLRAKDYVQIKRIKPEDLEKPERMAEVGRCMSFFYRVENGRLLTFTQ